MSGLLFSLCNRIRILDCRVETGEWKKPMERQKLTLMEKTVWNMIGDQSDLYLVQLLQTYERKWTIKLN